MPKRLVIGNVELMLYPIFIYFNCPLSIGNLNFFPVLGYVLNEDGKECVDEDECAASNNRICGNGKYHNGIAFSEIYYLVITMLS